MLQEAWEPTFSESSSGCRPQRRAPQAVGQAQASSRDGSTWVVDSDLEPFFDRVNQDVLLSRVRRRVKARRVRTLEGSVEPPGEGPPQGGPLSPRMANLRLDALAKELEQRGPRFARDADDAHIYVRRRQAGERVLARVRRFLERTLRLKGNEAKSAVERPGNRTFRGCTVTRCPGNRRQVRENPLLAVKAQVRALPGRTGGRPSRQLGQAWRQRLRGGRAFVGFAEGRSPLGDLDQWSRATNLYLRRRREDG